jgi:uncharacterized protein (DUF1697 family)
VPRYVAFLRGVSPTNASMPELKRCFEQAGFTRVKTVLSSGNVVFDSTQRSEAGVERKAGQAMERQLDRAFYPIVRSVAALEQLLADDPFARHRIPPGAKRVVTFMRDARAPKVKLPYAADGASVLCQVGREAFTAYVPGDKGPVFMKLIENAFGKDVTTRTWDTVRKCAVA